MCQGSRRTLGRRLSRCGASRILEGWRRRSSNALEEATWTRVFAELEPAQFAEALGRVCTILGAAKDA
ncbi:MAG: hypothetical protein ACXWYO_08120, partial [Gaiellaceae bacterium]